jgi:hypothetical protein
MRVTVKIDTENAAFSDGNSGTETARILRDLADRIDGEPLNKNDCRFAMDSNGNRVGQLKTSSR